MNHSIRLNTAEANARFAIYAERFPERNVPLFQFEKSASILSNLDNLALLALHHNATLTVLYAYKPIFLDLMARWVENPAKFENAFCEAHKIPSSHIPGSIVFMALSRVVDLYPESCNLIELFMEQNPIFLRVEDAIITGVEPTSLNSPLLAFSRVYNAKPHKFKQFLSVTTLHKVLDLTTEYSVAKYLAIGMLASYLNASEISKDNMIKTHIQKNSLVNTYDADYKIDYHFLALVEAKRLSNHTKLPNEIECQESRLITITPGDLSLLVISICGVIVSNPSRSQSSIDNAVETKNSVQVLRQLARNIQNDRPVMLYGGAGSGKTFLINQLAQYLSCQDEIVKIHLGEQTDAKLLLGTYTSGEKPGSFQWRSGVLTTAVKEGKWVLVEDIDKAPTEVLSILLTLLEKRELSIPSRGEVIRAHSGFQLISTIRTLNDGSSKVPDMIGLRLWELIEVQTPNEIELRNILVTKFPLLKNLIAKFIIVYNKVLSIYSMSSFISLNKGSHPRVISTRDLMKFCSRCDRMLKNKGITSPDALLESHLYENIFAETVECFGSAITEHGALVPLVSAIGEILEVPTSRTNLFLQSYVPNLHVDEEKIEIGRAVLWKSAADKALYIKKKSGNDTNFARTKHSKRLMEQIGVAIEMVEPVLLVGETGTGKTTVVQEIAKIMNKKLTVINVSQQTESGDLLGGYKPVNTKTVAIPLQEVFENLFLATFSQKKNAKFSQLLSKCFNKNQWKNVIKLWNEAVKMAKELLAKVEDSDEETQEGGPKKKRKLRSTEKSVLLKKWLEFKEDVSKFEAQASNLESSFVFSFVEGSLVKAVKNGEWLLLDEINLASPDTLESIADLLSESLEQRSILLSERGDVEAIRAHQDFRIFGCMNPSTDVGKRDLPLSIRSRFSEIYVHSPDRDREDLLSIIDKYIDRYAVGDEWVADDIAELYTEAKNLAETNKIVDGANQKPHFSIRTLTRTLIYVRDIVAIYGLRRALYEGFCMAFLTLLDIKSEKILQPVIEKFTIGKLKNAKAIISRCPPAPSTNEDEYVQFRHYWMKRGPGEVGSPNYIITPFVEKNLLNLVRATASRKFPVLVQGPTSAGKTSMINYLASITGHKFVRINNHEHTDLQEYLGTYVSDASGKLVFREGVLVEALKKGHWIVLDELNLAPTDVLEALNRLLDDNRELFIPETQEVVHPHPDFMLFATQNPPGLYGGRKVLSRAFRNRFLELHFDDIPQDELEIILKERCQIAPSYGKKIVEVYKQLSLRRQSTRLFEQKNSFATLRDLFRWAMREAVGYEELAANGYMLLAERVRNDEEKVVVKETIEKVMRVKLDMDAFYEKLEDKELMSMELSIVWTKAMRRLAVLVKTSIQYKEPLLLVGETGCGKTTVCQILASLLGRQIITVNAHQNTETGDILGAQRPLRNRFEIRSNLLKNLITFFNIAKIEVSLDDSKVEDLIKKYQQVKNRLLEDETVAIDQDFVNQIDENIKNSTMLFEWMDGPLIQAMKTGEFFLLDEISLADDSVLERLNSVLEPERSLLLAEKGTEDAFLTASDTFQFLATMNPGGDYGKKELSPALRNRFTEIWVPSMDDFNDVKQIVSARLKPRFFKVCEPLVDFAEWFGKRLGNGNANSGVISLRDILAWVEFLNSCEDSILPEAALLHGASMVFIDALGTNNTAYLAENEETLARHKKECIAQLSTLVNMDLSQYLEGSNITVNLTTSTLEAGVFQIPRLPNQEWNDPFNLHAPTTAANAMRVVRAMQVPKPILLEGSPGVGKTSLISAISKATGNPLIRINLSEQTDLIDLFGSDAPVEGGQTGEFVWRDAPFLRAMKNGEWVLLDEMNLASQSVLEGLNACLDHRGEAYIPELDRSFPRHPDFKVFAAQNPQYQGGGRKGLPKSFVNRFTVVYVDILKPDDLTMISHQIFPNVPKDDCAKMITFMASLEEQVVTKKAWGTYGGPWEFNLRDTMRWLALYNSKHNLESKQDASLSDFLKMIVCQRFRTLEDRENAVKLFEGIFGPQNIKDSYYSLGPDYVQSGGSVIKRNDLIQFSNSTDKVSYVPLQTNFDVLESAIRSVNENIPLILTGPTNSGKTETIRFLANVVGVKLVEFAMNSDVDSMDILGGYEQVDLTRSLTEIISSVHSVLNLLIVINLQQHETENSLLAAALGLIQYIEDVMIGTNNFNEFLKRFMAFLSMYSNEELSSLLRRCQELGERLQDASTVKFKWFDGLLVQAVSRGDWLVLDNANLCNPSVLDRLNSLLETNGTLIINECSEEDGSPRVLQPHPNFRLFLTVDPKYGELSRAMRNRCVEVFLNGLEERATSFDKLCLGMERSIMASTTNSEIEDMMENLEVEEISSTAKPMTSFISCTDSKLRNIVAVHDAIDLNNESVVSSSLAGVLILSHIFSFSDWVRTAISVSEFSDAEKSALEDTEKLVQGLNDCGFVENAKNMYDSTNVSEVVSSSFSSNQTTHPLINCYILGYIEKYAPAVDNAEPAMLLQVVSGAIRANSFLSYVENKALHGKASELSFIELSAAKSLGRELKRTPKIDIYSYIKGVNVFISLVIGESMKKDNFFKEESLYSEIAELQSLWFSLLEVCTSQNISKLRVFHSKLSSWFEKNSNVVIISQFSSQINSLDLGLKLTSGFSMAKIWEKFRQIYPDSEVSWENYVSLLTLLNDLDSLSHKLYPETYGEVSLLRAQILSIHDDIIGNELKSEELTELFESLSTAMKKLSELSETFVIQRNNEFQQEFTYLSNFLEVSALFGEKNFDKQMILANYTSKDSSAFIHDSKSTTFTPYPRILDSFWNTDGSKSIVGAIFTNELLSSSLTKSVRLELCPGKYLDQNLTDMKTLGKEIIEGSVSILENQQVNFRRLVLKWFFDVIDAHGVTLEEKNAETLSCADIEELVKFINESIEPSVASIFNDYFLPALYLATASLDLSDLGKAWVLFSSGCIQLFVPSSPLDPAIEEHVAYDVLESQKKVAQSLVESWRKVRSVISGDNKLQLEEYLPDSSETKLTQPRVYRKNESIDELFEEWNAFMESSIDVEPIKNLLAAAEHALEERNAQIIGIFQKNSSNFMMRLGSKYFIYADLNDILNGFIKGVKLGLDIFTTNTKQQDAKFQISSMWPVDLTNLLSPQKLESTFLTVKSMSKSMDVGSLISEKLMVYIVGLCFMQKSSTKDSALSLVLSQALQSLYYRWYYRRMKAEEQAAQQGSLYKHKDTDDEEGDFRELFPDYDEVMDLSAQDLKKTDDFDEVYYEIVDLYVNHFLHGTSLSLEKISTKGSRLCADLSAFKNTALDANSSSFLSALILGIQNSFEVYSVNTDIEVDFYHDAHPAEYRRAMKTILSLYSGVAKLLTQWPEHATLQSISRSAEEFLSYPSNYPLAKLLHKIELIFNFMNEWEKFASSQVTLKNHYEELTQLIVSWRRLELSSWKCLFQFEKSNVEKGIGKWWFHLFESIIVPFIQYQDELTENEDSDKPSVVQILAALNIFMSETTYGEYIARLNLVKAFKNHIATLNLNDGEVYNALCNLITFYEQFVPKIEDAIAKTQKTLEKDVSEVILLASWKDVNIDALKQSSRKSHNNLYKIVRKYRTLLNQPVSAIIQGGVPEETRVVIDEATLRVAEPVSKTKEEKLAILKSCNAVATWSERPNRLKNMDTIENNMKIYVDKIAKSDAPSLYDYSKEVIEEMKRLRDETPKVMNDDTKKTIAALKTQKHKLLSETLKELRRIGVKTSIKPGVKKVLTTVNLIFANSETFEDSLLQGSDPYYFRILDILPRLRSAIAGGNDDIPQPDLERGLAATENLIFSLLTTRKPLCELAESVKTVRNVYSSFQSVANNETGDLQPTSVVESIALNLDQLRQMSTYLCKYLDFSLSVLGGISLLYKTVPGDVFSVTKSKLEKYIDDFPESTVFTNKEATTINTFKTILTELVDSLKTWKVQNPAAAFVADGLLEWIAKWPYRPFINTSTSLKEIKTIEDVEISLRKLSNSILIAVQQVLELTKDEVTDDDDDWLANSQKTLMSSIKLLHHKKIVETMLFCKQQIEQIEYNSETSAIVSALVAWTMPLVSQYQKLVLTILERARTNYVHLSRATHAMAKSLHTLATEGFCSPEPPSEQKQDNNLHDGTGLGDGEGATNNSKDEEEDDDLAEHAQQPNEDKDKDDNEDDDDDAVDMEGDMAGDLEETSDQEKDEDEKDGDDEEELDEEVDDIDDLDPNAVDEKMWDEEAKEDEKEKDSDKTPQNSTNDDDNMEANEDEEESKDNKNENGQDDENNDENDENDNESGDDEEDVGEQEDEVKNQENEQMDDFVPETETLDLPEDMNLDDEQDKEGDEDEEEEFEDKMDMSDDEKDDKKDSKAEEEAVQEEEESEGEENGEENNEMENDEENEENEEAQEENEVGGGEIDEENNIDSDEDAAKAPEDEDDKPEENDEADNGEEAAEGVEGAENNNDEDVDMDSATKTEAGEKGDGSDNQVIEEQDDIGASGGASSDMKQEEDSKDEAPNEDSARDEMKESLKQLGDSLKEFHRRRQEIKESSQQDKKEETEDKANTKPDEFEHVDGDNTSHDTQALGAADNKDQVQKIDEDMAIDDEDEQINEEEKPTEVKQEDEMEVDENAEEVPEKSENDSDDFDAKSKGAVVGERKRSEEDEDTDLIANAEFEDLEAEKELRNYKEEEYTINQADAPAMDMNEARDLWRHSEVSTQELASGLSEQLRLILEPTLATKLRGDYKTGKRLNMKRIIPYIASDFRKDKIWLRRTKPSKRQYQIMIAVDDSKSMSESKSTELAFHSIALVSKALTQLESGGLSIVRFGEDVKLVHPFDKPFNQESGANVFQWFDFKQERTDIKQLCTKSLKIFENARATSNSDLWQLQIIISDGVCEDHETIQRLVRKAREEKVMLVFVVIDGITSNESIMDMSQVSYVADPITGAMSLKVENYLDTFPFEFYVVVRNISELPEMLSLILRQYFSEIANI